VKLPTAHIVHRLKGRLRLKVPGKRGDSDWFAATAARVQQVPGVRRVTVQTRSASILIVHRPGAQLGEQLAAAGLFTLTDELVASPPVLDPIMDGISRSHRRLARRTGGRANLQTVLIAMLLLAAFVQTLRGQIMVPAVSFAWYAASLAVFARGGKQR
jgi:hypothetical protein